MIGKRRSHLLGRNRSFIISPFQLSRTVLFLVLFGNLGCQENLLRENSDSQLTSITDEISAEDGQVTQENVDGVDLLVESFSSESAFKNLGTGFCIDVPASSTKSSIQLIQYGCNGDPNQLFELRQSPLANYFFLVSKASGLCMDIYGDSIMDGAKVVQYPCNGGQNQMFQLRESTLGTQLVVRHSQKCVVPVNQLQGGGLVQQACSSSTTQKSFYWTLGGSLLPPPPPPSPTGGLVRAGRNFVYNGKPTLLLGWDTQELVARPEIDYVAKLDWLKTNGVNKVRIWIYCYFNIAYLHPWVYANGYFDLDKFNEAYWLRVKNFLAAAKARDIVVEISIFSANAFDRPEDWTSTFFRFAFNTVFNLNGAFRANSSGHFNPEFHTLDYLEKTRSGKTLKDIQQALVDKTLSETSGYDNVYYEVSNEFPGQNATMAETYPWALYWARYIKQRTQRLVGVHANQWYGMQNIGLEYFMNDPSIDVLTFHAGSGLYTDNQATRISSLWHPAQIKGKILQTNEGSDPYVLGYNPATNHALSYIMSGASFAHYEDDPRRVGGSVSAQATARLKILGNLASLYQFTTLSPVDPNGIEYDSLVVNGPAPYWQVLAKPGERYVAYFSGLQRNNRTQIKVPAGTFSCIWIDPRTGAKLLTQTCSSASGLIDTGSPSSLSWDRQAGLLLVITK